MRRTSLVLVLVGSGCFDPTDLDGDEEGTGGPTGDAASDTDPSASGSASVSESESVTDSVTLTDPSESESDTQPTGTSLDASSSSDPSADGSSTSTTTTDPDDDSSTTAPPPDMGVPGPCDTFDPECPEGFKCNAYADDGGSSWNAQFCFPLDADPVGVGESCEAEESGASGIDNCEFGAICWNVDPDTLEGECVEYCGGTSDAPTCAVGHTCVTANNSVLNLCLPYCDPLLQDCSDGEACYPYNEGFICFVDASGEQGAYGDGCEYINVCDPGLFCAPTDVVPGCTSMAGCCTPYCDLTDPAPNCPGAGQECVALLVEGEEPPGLEDVGGCLQL
jgi:hypothetical protein